MRYSLALLTTFALSIALPGQDASNAPLIIRTNSEALALGMVMSFGSDAPAPKSVEGSHFVLTLDDGGMINASVEEGDAPFLSIDAKPAQLMDVFADDVAQAEQTMQMLGGMALMGAGMGASDISQALDGVFAFPSQIDALHLTVQENPQTNFKIDAVLELSPKSGSWFGNLVSNSQVHSAGLLSILDPQAMITFESNLDISKLGEVLKPLLALSAKMGAKPGEDLAKATKFIEEAFASMDGTLSINFNPGQGGLVGINGLRDASLYKKILHGGDLAELYAIQQRKNRMIEYEIEDGVFEHRDVKVLKVIQTMEGAAANIPFVGPDGSITSLYAVAGESMLMASVGAEAGEMKQLIDSVSDKSIKRKTLGPNTLAQISIHLAEIVDFVNQMAGPDLSTDRPIPQNLSVVVKKVGGNLRIEVSSK